MCQSIFLFLGENPCVERCSDDGLRLLCGLLRLNPMERMSIESVCENGYFRDSLYSAVMHGEYGE